MHGAASVERARAWCLATLREPLNHLEEHLHGPKVFAHSKLFTTLFVGGLAIWLGPSPAQRAQWLQTGRALACYEERDVQRHQALQSSSVREAWAQILVKSNRCVVLVNERVRLQAFSENGTSASVLRGEDGRTFWLARADLSN